MELGYIPEEYGYIQDKNGCMRAFLNDGGAWLYNAITLVPTIFAWQPICKTTGAVHDLILEHFTHYSDFWTKVAVYKLTVNVYSSGLFIFQPNFPDIIKITSPPLSQSVSILQVWTSCEEGTGQASGGLTTCSSNKNFKVLMLRSGYIAQTKSTFIAILCPERAEIALCVSQHNDWYQNISILSPVGAGAWAELGKIKEPFYRTMCNEKNLLKV